MVEADELIQLGILFTLMVTALFGYLGVRATRDLKTEAVRPRIYPTNIWLNPWERGSKDEVTRIADGQFQRNPLIHRLLQRDLGRSDTVWSLYSKKAGKDAPIQLQGQVNLKVGGESEARVTLVQQKFVLDGRPLASPPDARMLAFVAYPDQTFNADFEVSVPDRDYGEGDLLYALRIAYEDSHGNSFEEHVYWWYDFDRDKFWNNMDKVPYFQNLKLW